MSFMINNPTYVPPERGTPLALYNVRFDPKASSMEDFIGGPQIGTSPKKIGHADMDLSAPPNNIILYGAENGPGQSDGYLQVNPDYSVTFLKPCICQVSVELRMTALSGGDDMKFVVKAGTGDVTFTAITQLGLGTQTADAIDVNTFPDGRNWIGKANGFNIGMPGQTLRMHAYRVGPPAPPPPSGTNFFTPNARNANLGVMVLTDFNISS